MAFENTNHQSLSKMLVHCGAGLVDLGIQIYRNVGTLKLIFPTFSLPNLRKLDILLMNLERDSDNLSHFVNSLLNAATALDQLVVLCNDDHYEDDDVLAFQFFTLPPSITSLDLSCQITNANLETLFKNDLPLLTSLTLMIPKDMVYPDGFLFRILGKFRNTLRKLTLQLRSATTVGVDLVNRLRFPVMEKLEEFANFSINCDLEDDIGPLEECLPKMSKLMLLNQTTRTFRKWTENSRFASVEDLTLHLADDMVDEEDLEEFGVGVNLERMQRLHLSFPNVRKLSVTVDPEEGDGLKYLFMKMRQLTHLKIKPVGDIEIGWDIWDALLIGAPQKFVAGLRGSPAEFWKKVQLATGDEFPSIKNLQDLTSLSLQLDSLQPLSPTPLISDLTFHFALLHMPKLQCLTLGYKLRPSDSMATTWTNQVQGRKLQYF